MVGPKPSGGEHERELTQEYDEEEVMATATSLEEEPGGHSNNKQMKLNSDIQ